MLAGVGLRQVDDPVRQVGDGPGGFGQIGGVHQPETQMGGQPVDHGPGDRAAVVLGGGQQVGRDGLDLAEVVALPAHPVPQVGVRPPGLLRGGGPLGLDPGHRPVQADQRLQRLGLQPRPRPHRRDVQGLESVCALGLFQLDLQRGPAAGGRDGQQVGQRCCPARRPAWSAATASPPACRSRSATAPTALIPASSATSVSVLPDGLAQVPELPPDRQRVGSGARRRCPAGPGGRARAGRCASFAAALDG